MQFDIAVHGIDYNVLQGSLKFMIEGVEYGFPVNVLKDEIAVDVPALDEIIKRGLIDGSEVECKLDIFGEGFYMSPWEGQFKLLTPARVEATMVYSDSSRGSKPSITLMNKSKDTSKQTIVKEVKKEVVEETIEAPLMSGNETQQMLKLLEKLVNQRHVKEGNEFSGDEDSTLEDELKSATDKVHSQYEDPDEPNDEEDAVFEECDDGIVGSKGGRAIFQDDDAEEGIVAHKKGKAVFQDDDDDDQNYDYESPLKKPMKKEQRKLKPRSKFVRMRDAVNSALNKDPNFANESKSVRKNRRKKLLKALMIKEAKRVKKAHRTKKTIKESVKKKRYRIKEPGEIIHESDIYKLFNSVGMTSPKSQKRLIERAKELGNKEPEDIYATIKKFIGPTEAASTFNFIQEKINK